MRLGLSTRARTACALALCVAGAAHAQTAEPPQVLGPWIGPGAPTEQPDLRLYGTDLGWTVEHDGKLEILFGDTWPHSRSVCEPDPTHDDSQARIPLALPVGGSLPPVEFYADPSAPNEFARIRLERQGQDLLLGYGQVPIAAFSDGRRVVGLFNRGELVRCQRVTPAAEPSCPPQRGDLGERLDHRAGTPLVCSTNVGECVPDFLGLVLPCDVATGGGCFFGQACAPSTTGFCTDPTSSQSDGTPASDRFTIAQENDFAFQRRDEPTHYDSVALWRTNKFINATTRSVRRFTGTRRGNDFRPGDGALFVWGRPGYTGEQGREAQLYLMVQPLPMRAPGSKRHRGWPYTPLYFAGADAKNRPRWSPRQSQAAPLALDGRVGGSPHEAYPIVDQMAIAWVDAPIRKWVMLYGGDVDEWFLADPANARPGPAPGAIQIRFADQPWGPWSEPQPHLIPGSPSVVGDMYGPGGVLYHHACVDQGPATCARTDPTRPLHSLNPGCAPFPVEFEIGYFYAPNIIDAYTKPDGAGGVDLYWNVSTWNPYAVLLLKTKLRP